MCISALITVFGATITLGALLFNGALLFFLHSAFLILHSASLKLSVWVSTCIFSLIVSQRAILFILVQLLFNSKVWSAYLLICRVRFLMILCVSIVILILYKTFRFSGASRRHRASWVNAAGEPAARWSSFSGLAGQILWIRDSKGFRVNCTWLLFEICIKD